MDSHYAVLDCLQRNDKLTQRDIARYTGLSVGGVNLLLKKMVRKGLVKLEKVNGRSLRYILTPQGMAEKTRLAYQYMQSTYRQIVKTGRVLAEVVAERPEPVERIIFYGPRDEVLEILKIAAGNLHIKHATASCAADLAGIDGRNTLVITWQAGEEYVVLQGIEVVNIIDRL
ncbi:MarR family transcriptional regulator [Neomoorella mulderi]|uniref:MarR family protein n=1 Tax=Moorella mulderi DSM 14980 TaxID=1122241 RepID=A0A151AZK1_9FIRM|nr:MarR family transcriptional regulator [Moorella mulderi]KYH32837.1 MarR family protein [Moorella mulderi DSM 14980]